MCPLPTAFWEAATPAKGENQDREGSCLWIGNSSLKTREEPVYETQDL